MFMFETIKRIYAKTGNADAVTKAVARGWITQEEAGRILSITTTPEGSPE